MAASLGGFAPWSGDIVAEEGCVMVMGVMMLCLTVKTLLRGIELVRMEKATARPILSLLFTSGDVPQLTSAHHVLVTVLRSAAGQTPISLVSKKGKSLTMVAAASQAASLLTATPAGMPSLLGLFGLCVQPGTLHKR